jgi:hypothetical protein
MTDVLLAPFAQVLRDFLIGKITISHFAERVYAENDLPTTIGSEWDDRLLAFDYRAKTAEHDLHFLVRQIYRDICPRQETEQLFWRLDLVRCAKTLLEDTIDFVDGVLFMRMLFEREFSPEHIWEDPDFSTLYSAALDAEDLPYSMSLDLFSDNRRTQILHDLDLFKQRYRGDVRVACQHIVARYQP